MTNCGIHFAVNLNLLTLMKLSGDVLYLLTANQWSCSMLYVWQEWYLYPIYVDTDERCVAFTWVQLADEHDYSRTIFERPPFFSKKCRQSNIVANTMHITGTQHNTTFLAVKAGNNLRIYTNLSIQKSKLLTLNLTCPDENQLVTVNK